MKAANTSQDDPQHPGWSGLAWSDWYLLSRTGDGSGLVPVMQGIYRVRCRDHGHPELIYIGITVRGLRSRIGSLRRGVPAFPGAVHCRFEHAG
jgi:hypothetical protein